MENNKKIIYGITIFIIVLVVGFFIFFSSNGSNNVGASTASTNTNSTNSNSGNTLFSSTPYFNYAYLISGPTLDSNAQQALSGFNLQKTTLPDGSLNISLTTTNPGYYNQNYVVKSGQKLYFIETSMGDDSYPDGDGNLRDDSAVLVDSNGYIVQ